MVDRVALVLTPKRRFVEWVNTLPEMDGARVSMDDVKSLRTVFLAAVADEETDLQDLVEAYCHELFDASLAAWSDDESRWPVNRTPHVFRDWFLVELIDEVGDMDPSEPMLVSDRLRTRCANCQAPLGEDAVVIGLREDGTQRLTPDEAARHEAREAEAADEGMGAARPGALTIVVRCCGDDCASELESSYAGSQAGQDPPGAGRA